MTEAEDLEARVLKLERKLETSEERRAREWIEHRDKLEAEGRCKGTGFPFCGEKLPCAEHTISLDLGKAIFGEDETQKRQRETGVIVQHGPGVVECGMRTIREIQERITRLDQPVPGGRDAEDAVEIKALEWVLEGEPTKPQEPHVRINLMLNKLSGEAGDNKELLLLWLEHAVKSVELEIKLVKINMKKMEGK